MGMFAAQMEAGVVSMVLTVIKMVAFRTVGPPVVPVTIANQENHAVRMSVAATQGIHADLTPLVIHLRRGLLRGLLRRPLRLRLLLHTQEYLAELDIAIQAIIVLTMVAFRTVGPPVVTVIIANQENHAARMSVVVTQGIHADLTPLVIHLRLRRLRRVLRRLLRLRLLLQTQEYLVELDIAIQAIIVLTMVAFRTVEPPVVLAITANRD
ncbi:uncharacterized protein EI90DRAFT_3080577 [Cantharellus anzutake]|uniref:uncharacterized protein n=1 Tax=Cantharellus anzutake TaxID=1750568 RepID=UPI001907E4A3|nr:uncharacterized protein EI90DRAFT_3080577 [Cantharellus anzutake]KAF8320552.1 hypothetical protein EI90DRAFT_3080577 [Cantharellus anzutake]